MNDSPEHAKSGPANPADGIDQPTPPGGPQRVDAPSGPAAEPEGQQEVLESDPGGDGPDGLAGGMGTSSERVGRLRGSDAEATHGVADTSETASAGDDGPPEQSADSEGTGQSHP